MKSIAKTALLLTVLISTTAFADAAEGKELLAEAKCMECHNAEDFKNSKKVKNFHQLEARVDACQRNTDAGWFDEDTTSVAEFLDKKYYKLKK